jgi:sugar O-acyltransferase (sialic acid O-acetyltransferase NeuD family)
MENVIVIGTGGLAREFTSYFARQVNVVGYYSTNRQEHGEFSLPGTLFDEDVTPSLAGTKQAVIAIGSPIAKRNMFEKFRAAGFEFPSIFHSSSVVSEDAVIEQGVIISPACVISPNVKIGEFAYLNFSSGVGHDATIGKYVQINPGVQIGGRVAIGDDCLVGSGATVLPSVSIGAHATVASGSVVFARVAERATVMGNPAKRMRAFEK